MGCYDAAIGLPFIGSTIMHDEPDDEIGIDDSEIVCCKCGRVASGSREDGEWCEFESQSYCPECAAKYRVT